MSRRNAADKREVLPDPIYNSTVVTKLINQIMLQGKRGIAQNIVYDAFEVVKEKLNMDALDVFNQTVENIKPLLETKPRRVGGATYQVPMEIRPDRRQTLAIRWLVLFARKRSGEKEMHRKLAAEIIDAYNNAGGAIKRKEEMHRTAEANKAFAHYKW
ncbi:MAG: 30S ribosomal protein S7 [Christensenellaceae bacterium]|jgi:small subunit ribosomal protein S7|nr:30S ribosomal protein S7 [Christensenellaceae bacterium]